MHWYAGTSGYSYKEWLGSFYPEALKTDAMLGYYAVRLPTVEINNTFYRMPRTQVLQSWCDAVPNDFRFVVKASRRITHQLRLNDAQEPTEYLARKLEALGDKLGAVLFQLPPYLRKDMDRLRSFLDVLPQALPSAFEFRHASWLDDEVFDLLAKRNRAICASEDDESEAPMRLATTDWLYLRLRKTAYDDAMLKAWHRTAQATPAKHAFVFFKHEDEATGPATAARFLELTRVETKAALPPRRAAPRQTQKSPTTKGKRA
ncbi:MAG: DUF72 domain-containing protein [Gammaproteobacteria bacterium]|nr:DUF72 domain-containing protein [Gammaproteobacteria bacterium]